MTVSFFTTRPLPSPPYTTPVDAARPKRRSQVEKSLAQTAKLKPDAWHLIVPINHNPSELEWFDGLKATYHSSKSGAGSPG